MPGRLGEWILSNARSSNDPYTPAPRRVRRLSNNSVILPADGPKRKSRMPVFNVLRLSVYGVSLLWTIICFAIAVHFHKMLQADDLTRFVPLAIFICVSSLLILLALVGFSLRRLNPITTRIEMGCLALASLLWIILSGVLANSAAADASVECYVSESETVTVDVPGFNTETFEAQYRVLEAFSIFNVLLLLGFLSLLVLLSVRQHLMGNTNVWTAPLTAYPWFTRYTTAKLPAPVTAARSNSQSSRELLLRRGTSEKRAGVEDIEKRGRGGRYASPEATPASTPGSTPRGFEQTVLWMPKVARTAERHYAGPGGYGATGGAGARAASRPPPKAGDKYRRDASPVREDRTRRRGDKYARDASPRR